MLVVAIDVAVLGARFFSTMLFRLFGRHFNYIDIISDTDYALEKIRSFPAFTDQTTAAIDSKS